MIAVTLLQPYPWCLAQGLLAVLPIGKSLGDPISRQWRKHVEKRRIAIRSSASRLAHEVIKAMKRRMKPEDYMTMWNAVLEVPLGAIVGTAISGCTFVGDEINQLASLVDVQKGTVCVSFTEFEALPEPVFVAGVDEHLSIAEWDGRGAGLLLPTTESQGRLF